MMRLYSYFRSSASWRVRIGLHLKGISYELVPVHLLRDGGEHRRPEYLRINPMATVPLLEVLDEDGRVVHRLGESLAILHYLDEEFPQHSLLPGSTVDRARARWIAEIINSGVHPLQNLGVLQALERDFHVELPARRAWACTWIERGFTAMEEILGETAGRYCLGNTVTLADVCLVPQVYNARKFGVEVQRFPRIARIADALAEHPSFVQTDPHHQPDTPLDEQR